MSQFDYVKTKREDVKVITEDQMKKAKPFMRMFSRLQVWVYKKSGGRLMKTFNGNRPICVVGMQGAKSGRRIEMPLMYLPHGDNVLLVASQGGMPKHPLWYYNITANPRIDITVAGVTRQLVARRVSEDEKRALWPHLVSLYPDFDEYQARTDRPIPVFECTPITS